MRQRLFTTGVGLLLAAAAHAASPSARYAVLSLVGDRLDIVTYQPTTGSRLDPNIHTSLALPQDELDISAIRAIRTALKTVVPTADVILLAGSTPADFAHQEALFLGDHVTLPGEIDAAIHREGATMLVLVSKHQGSARLQAAYNKLGSGRVEGLGFYVDKDMQMQDVDTGERGVGYLAPFVSVDVTLIDLATNVVVRRATIATGQVVGSEHNVAGADAWNSLSSAEKVAALTRLLTSELASAVPPLVSGSPAASGGADR